jgi:hypothetical protein
MVVRHKTLLSSAWLLARSILTRAAIGQWVIQGACAGSGVAFSLCDSYSGLSEVQLIRLQFCLPKRHLQSYGEVTEMCQPKLCKQTIVNILIIVHHY